MLNCLTRIHLLFNSLLVNIQTFIHPLPDTVIIPDIHLLNHLMVIHLNPTLAIHQCHQCILHISNLLLLPQLPPLQLLLLLLLNHNNSKDQLDMLLKQMHNSMRLMMISMRRKTVLMMNMKILVVIRLKVQRLLYIIDSLKRMKKVLMMRGNQPLVLI